MCPTPCFISAGRGLLLRRALPHALPIHRPTGLRLPFRPARCCATGAPPPPPPADDDEPDALPSSQQPPVDAVFSAFDAFLEESGLLDGEADETGMSKRDRRRLALEREEEFRRRDFEQRLDVLTALPDDLFVKQVADKCPGCGCELQSRDESLPGFLPEDIREARARELLAMEAAAKEGADVSGKQGVEAEDVDALVVGRGNVDLAALEAPPPEDASGIPGLSAADIADFRAILQEEGVVLPLSGEAKSSGIQVVDAKDKEATHMAGKAVSVVCQRCFRLNNYGTIESGLRVESPRRLLEKVVVKAEADDTAKAPVEPRKTKRAGGKNVLTPATFRQNLQRLRTKPSVIVYLVDVFDFHGTFLSGLRDIIGDRSPVFLAVNKVDLLPKDYKPERVEKWVRHEAAALGMEEVQAVHLVSSTRGTGVKMLLADALNLARKRRCDIYVVGAANVGKSSFINHIMSVKMRRVEANANRKSGYRAAKAAGKGKGKGALTTSVIPGTTLDVIRVPLDKSVSLYDTPGIIMTHQLTNSLDAQELRAVLPARSVERVTLRLGEGKALYLGALARIEVVEGRPFFFTAFVSPDVKVHPGRAENADEFAAAHVGELLTPPYNADRLEELGEWSSKTFTADGTGWKRACVDIVLSGLGWVSVTGAGSVRLKVCAPKGVGVFTRDPLMPFEVRVSGASRYTGTRAINAREANKAERKRKDRRREIESSDYI
jgi:30S ribosome assembly GTPase